MSKVKQPKYWMKQCNMTKETENGVSNTVSWIPEEYAKVGRILKLKNDDDVWVDGWKVVSASSGRRSYEECNERSQDYKRTRKASDI
jgi:hypothetical protein